MAISYIGQATGVDTVTLPAHEYGDLFVVFAFAEGTNIITTPAGWTYVWGVASGSAPYYAGKVYYRVAASESETPGTWTGATSTIVQVYRGALSMAVSGGGGAGFGNSSTITYESLTFTKTNNTSWAAAFAGVFTNTTNALIPTGMTGRSSVVDAVDKAVGHDSNGTLNGWSAQTVETGSAATNWMSQVVEIIAKPPVNTYTIWIDM